VFRSIPFRIHAQWHDNPSCGLWPPSVIYRPYFAKQWVKGNGIELRGKWETIEMQGGDAKKSEVSRKSTGWKSKVKMKNTKMARATTQFRKNEVSWKRWESIAGEMKDRFETMWVVHILPHGGLRGKGLNFEGIGSQISASLFTNPREGSKNENKWLQETRSPRRKGRSLGAFGSRRFVFREQKEHRRTPGNEWVARGDARGENWDPLRSILDPSNVRIPGNKEKTAESCHRSPFPFRITPTIYRHSHSCAGCTKIIPTRERICRFLGILWMLTGIEPEIRNFSHGLDPFLVVFNKDTLWCCKPHTSFWGWYCNGH